MAKSATPPLQHMLEAIEDIQSIIRDREISELETNRRDRLAIERNFEIISEASRRLPDNLKQRHPEIPWNRVAGIGNVLRHDYDEIALGILLRVATDHLPDLERACREELIREQDQERKTGREP